ncbi:MAG TPA: tRNA (adenosine(37)-N6)-threonylcarbamoyltransferase complex ATPase subunit type 1 TsaE [Rhodobacteraceae bacterium]|nr:tRNA (adenosine(37)-N6)-threonylcarbamoyltransferase complex ATPase subunit type 1 TsaE [Paracoccaceae bacterium]
MTKSTPSPQLRLETEADTTRLATAFARHMCAGDVLLLNGGLAAGKTFFVSAAVAALGAPDAVSSPTYTLANIYASPKGPVVHMDAYRLKSPADFADLALEDEFARGLAFIEWGAMLAGEFDDYVSLELAQEPAEEQARLATLTSEGPRGAELLAHVLKDFTT